MKNGIDYFPLECRLDDKQKLIKAEFGLTGRAIIVDLYAKIYAEEGYYCVWDSEVALLFASEEGVGGTVVSEVVNAAIKRGIFDKDKYEQYGILTSRGIQKRYFEAVSRRVSVEAKNEYLCFNVAEKYKNVYISGENVCRNAENVYRNEQSKVDKSRVNKSIVNQSKEEENVRAGARALPSMKDVQDYLSKYRYTFTAERFFKYYEDHPPFPKDWQRCCDAWEARAADADYGF